MPLARALRAILLAGTALVPLSAAAQAPDARPEFGRVVVGGITIEQDAARTAVTQAQQRGIVEWRRFDVGRDHAVEFRQPDARAVTLNRVEARDPSLIAGRITANGQVVIVNRSGVVFQQGAQVDAAGLVVTAADIADENFLAGRMVFDRPGEPGARVENNGHITVREAGLAALVAPRVVNNGVITARLGRVALAGGEAHTVDLHGDGLFEIEITRPVTVAPAGGGPLVENTGTILAEGGRVRITAAAADRIVQDLVRAGGRIGADTDAATGRTGDVVIAGTGGAIRVQGEVTARGTAPGTRGGVVEVLGNRVLAEPGAMIDVSGRAGGGEIAFGITRQGAAERRLAERTGVAAGARLNASATGAGDGGTIIVHSTHYTAVAGGIAARGGPEGGRGGFVEVSGERGLVVAAAPDAGAPAGEPGSVLIDPVDLTIVAAGDPRINIGAGDIVGDVLAEATPPDTAFIGADLVAGFLSDLRLEASNDITVETTVTAGVQSGRLNLAAGRDIVVNGQILDFPGLGLEAGRDIRVNVSLSAGSFPGDVALTAGRDIRVDAAITGHGLLGLGAGRDILVNAALGVVSDNTLALVAGGGIRLAADVDAPVAGVQLTAGSGGILQTAGRIRAASLAIGSAADALLTRPNEVDTLFGFGVTGDLVFDNGTTPLIATIQTATARSILLRTAAPLTLEARTALTATGTGGAGRVSLQATRLVLPTGSFSLTGEVVEFAPISAAPVLVVDTLPSAGFGVTPVLVAAVSAGTLRIGGATVGGVLTTTASGITFETGLDFGGTLDLRSLGGITQALLAGPIEVLRLTGAAEGGVLLGDVFNQVPELGPFTAGGEFRLLNETALVVPLGAMVRAAGDLVLTALGGDLTVLGTVRGGTVDLFSDGLLTVTGNSAIATAGGMFLGSSEAVLVDGLIEAAGEILIAAPSAFLAGTSRAGGGLIVSTSAAGFGGLDARTHPVVLRLGGDGIADGTLDAGVLLVEGGAAASLFGSVAGIGGRPAAARVVRSAPEQPPFGDPPPNAGRFLFNGCEMGVAACAPRRDLPRPEDLDVPGDPATVLRPPALALVFQPPRDPSEEEEQAAPDIRAGDF